MNVKIRQLPELLNDLLDGGKHIRDLVYLPIPKNFLGTVYLYAGSSQLDLVNNQKCRQSR